MFRYFPDSPILSQGILLALNSGGDINEIDRACKASKILDGVADPDSWYDAWCGVANTLVEQAKADETKGRKWSASHKYRRASVYFALAERYIPHTNPKKAKSYEGVLSSFEKFIELTGDPVERVEIPYENGKSLPGLFIPAPFKGPAATVIFVDGFDLYKELVYLRKNSDAARVRGMAMLIVDTPGIGEALRLRGITSRHDTEVPVGACVDWLEKRPEVDAKRIGIIGLSLGGYYAPRATAFEKRIKCCVAWAGQWDPGARRRQKKPGHSLSAPDSQLQWVMGQPTHEAAVEFVRNYTMAGVADKITVPLFIPHGEKDHLTPLEEGKRLAAEAVNSPKVEFLATTAEYGGEGHCSMDNMQTGVDMIYDWLADELGAHKGA